MLWSPRVPVVVLSLLASCWLSAGVAREAPVPQVTITRDDWGIAHVKGHTDADAVFGMIYAQAEDEFNRIEMNYLVSLGRLAEAAGQGEEKGESAIWADLRQRLFVDPHSLKADYARSPLGCRS
jgi:acyl-homoserine-lactone acylase